VPYRAFDENLRVYAAGLEQDLERVRHELEGAAALRSREAELIKELRRVRLRLETPDRRGPAGTSEARRLRWCFGLAAGVPLALLGYMALIAPKPEPQPEIGSIVCRLGWPAPTYSQLPRNVSLPNGATVRAFDVLNQGLPSELCRSHTWQRPPRDHDY
jgi:hypothetical protein